MELFDIRLVVYREAWRSAHAITNKVTFAVTVRKNPVQEPQGLNDPSAFFVHRP